MFKDRQAKDSAQISRNSFTALVCVCVCVCMCVAQSETEKKLDGSGKEVTCQMKERKREVSKVERCNKVPVDDEGIKVARLPAFSPQLKLNTHSFHLTHHPHTAVRARTHTHSHVSGRKTKTASNYEMAYTNTTHPKHTFYLSAAAPPNTSQCPR